MLAAMEAYTHEPHPRLAIQKTSVVSIWTNIRKSIRRNETQLDKHRARKDEKAHKTRACEHTRNNTANCNRTCCEEDDGLRMAYQGSESPAAGWPAHISDPASLALSWLSSTSPVSMKRDAMNIDCQLRVGPTKSMHGPQGMPLP